MRGERKEICCIFFISVLECLVRFNEHPKQYFFVLTELLVFDPAGPDIEPGRCTFFSIMVS